MRHLVLTVVIAAACTPAKPVDPPDGGPSTCDERPADAAPLRLLTRAEYDRTVRDLLGDTTQPARAFPREPKAFGFENNAELHVVTGEHVEAYLAAAEALAARAVKEQKARLVTCTAGEDPTVCGTRFVRDFGKKAFRRPLSTDEVMSLAGVFEEVRVAEGGFDAGLEAALTTMLQSPQFLYVVEPGFGGTGRLGSSVALDGYELASRLSYFLWGSMPDDALLAAAGAGALRSTEGLEAQARRLLASPKSAEAVDDFFRQWLELDSLNSVVKAPAVYPAFAKDGMGAAWRESLAAFTRDVYANEATLHALLTKPAVWVSPELAQAYGFAGHSGAPKFEKLATDASTRAGLLTQPGLLARLASPDQSSPVRRGLFVLGQLLCQPTGAPPPGANTVPPKVDASSTTRQRFAQHSAQQGCNQCHDLIDPAGFGFEHFDGAGAWRDTDNGQPVDASGAIVSALRDPELQGTFSSIPELAARLAKSPQVMDCVATTAFRFGLGRVESPDDGCALSAVQTTFKESGGDLKELLVAIATSDSFRLRRAPKVTP